LSCLSEQTEESSAFLNAIVSFEYVLIGEQHFSHCVQD
jgi:hypothetical protein